MSRRAFAGALNVKDAMTTGENLKDEEREKEDLCEAEVRCLKWKVYWEENNT